MKSQDIQIDFKNLSVHEATSLLTILGAIPTSKSVEGRIEGLYTKLVLQYNEIVSKHEEKEKPSDPEVKSQS